MKKGAAYVVPAGTAQLAAADEELKGGINARAKQTADLATGKVSEISEAVAAVQI